MKYKGYIIKKTKSSYKIYKGKELIKESRYGGLKNAKKSINNILEEIHLKAIGAGWKCPKGCKIESVLVPYSETVYGTSYYDLLDKDLINCYDSESTDSDNMQVDSPVCEHCGGVLEWSDGKNSLDFINKK